MFQLTLNHVIKRASTLFKDQQIVSKLDKGGLHRYTIKDFYNRVRRLASVLKEKFRVMEGDRIATFAWNTHRHLELYYAIPALGAVVHTVNVRLSADEVVYIINHAKDKIVFVDPDLAPFMEKIKDNLPSVKAFVIMDSQLPETSLSPIYCYEELVEMGDLSFEIPELKEDLPAGIIYTTGTTGRPKGTVYTHRMLYLAGLTISLPDYYAISKEDNILIVGPLFHAWGWFLPFAGMIAGSKQVYPGPRPKAKDIAELIEKEKITISTGVPTIWMDFVKFMEENKGAYDISSFKRVYIGGSAMPESLYDSLRSLGIEARHAWGMTEGPLATVSLIPPSSSIKREEDKKVFLLKQGAPLPGIELKIVDEEGNELPWNGFSVGELCYRGAWVIDEYFEEPERTKLSFLPGGWLRTGDAATIDEYGNIKIVDRFKDMIKSGGEWISSVDVENMIMNHPAVLEAAVIAVPHEKWQERPLACVVLKPEYRGKVTKENIIEFLRDKLAKWQLPDDVVFIEAIPKTSVGKFDKKVLREMYKNYKLS